jgi:hypothetical protein
MYGYLYCSVDAAYVVMKSVILNALSLHLGPRGRLTARVGILFHLRHIRDRELGLCWWKSRKNPTGAPTKNI